MRTEEVLAAVNTGRWQWENAAGTVTLDESAARLLGLPWEPGAAGTATVSEATVRSRIHVVDFVELQGIVTLAVAERALAEALVRVVTDDGTVVRTVRLRLRPVGGRTSGTAAAAPPETASAGGVPPGTPSTGTPVTDPLVTGTPVTGTRAAPRFHLIGLISEVPHPPPGAQDTPHGPHGRPGRPTGDRAAANPAQTTVTGDWRRSREAFLLDAGRALAEAHSTAEVLRVAGALAMPGFTPAGLAVFGVDGERLTIIGHHGHAPGDESPFLDMPLDTDYPGAQAVRTGRAVYLPTPDDYRRRFPTAWPLVADFGRHSWAYLPLTVAGRTVGAWMASFSHPVSFTPDERAVLSTVARMLAQALSRAYLHDTERELAHGLQQSMRPVHDPDITGMEIAARYVPTGGGLQIGGDWYDVIPLPSGRTAIVIGDVQGHDVRAAGIMSQLRIALRAYATEGHHPDGVLSRASRFLDGLNGDWPAGDERFATCLYLEIEPHSGTLDIARAGHPDPAVRMPDATMLVCPTEGGLPLGIDPDTDYPTSRLVLQPGETMLLCTDGLIETGGHDLDTGWARLREVCAAHPEPRTPGTVAAPGEDVEGDAAGLDPGGLEALADSLVQAVHGPPSHHLTGPLADRREDDIALLLLRRLPVTGAYGEGGELLAPVRRTVLTIAQAQPGRIADARHQLHSLLHDWRDREQSDGAVLMLSEMLTNVLVHTDGDALMVAEISGDPDARLLRVEVADNSDELPHRRSPGELASSGRGLMLMESLADAWGVDPRGDGKCIWFEVREPADGGAPAG